jgi:hypothetical protein
MSKTIAPGSGLAGIAAIPLALRCFFAGGSA